MTHRILVLLLFAGAPAVAAGLEGGESALNERLRHGSVPAARGTEDARTTAALAAVALAEGRSEEATRLFQAVTGREADCTLRARLAELGSGDGCAELQPQRLDAALLGPPAAYLIVAAREDEAGSSFPASVLVTALKAVAPAGGLTIESTADRFRVSGAAALEGLWYLEDRLLLVARPAPGRGGGETAEALETFLALRAPELAEGRAEPAITEPERLGESPEVVRLGVALGLPAGWSPKGTGAGWPAPDADRAEAFPPRSGALAVVPRAARQQGERRRNPLARRRPGGTAPLTELAALPAGAKLLGSRPLSGNAAITAIEWKPAGGGAMRRALLRTVVVGGRELLVVAHLGDRLTTEDARLTLDGARAARP